MAAATVVEAEAALEKFAQAWDGKYPTIAKQWRLKWADFVPLFDFPPAIRTVRLPQKKEISLRAMAAIITTLQAVDAVRPRFDNGDCVE